MGNILSMISLGSGSAGNCYYIFNDENAILIDCGINTRQIFLRLKEHGIKDPKIDAVFITHEHHDHMASCAILERNRIKESKNGPIFYMTNGTYHSANPKCIPKKFQCISDGEDIEVGSLTIEAFVVPHDGIETVGYRVGSGGYWAGVITDLGHVTDIVLDKMRSLTMMVLEFNHDVRMLVEGDYHDALKDRILSDYGHLSNAQAAAALQRAVSPRLQHLIIAHISEANNEPALAKLAAERALEQAGHGDIVTLHVADQNNPSPIYRVEELNRLEDTAVAGLLA